VDYTTTATPLTDYILASLFLIIRNARNWTPNVTNEPTKDAKKVFKETPWEVWAFPATELIGFPKSDDAADAEVVEDIALKLVDLFRSGTVK